MNEQITPIDAINKFYELKAKYEKNYFEKYVKKIIDEKKLSKREKRIQFSKLPKHECINCKRNVGTLFSIRTHDKEFIKIYNVKCGDIQDPCPLDIEINYSIRLKLDTIIGYGSIQIERLKLEIIKEKNNALFFNKNVVNIFEKLTEELKAEIEDTGVLIETRILRMDNSEKDLLLKKMADEFGKGYILPFKQMVKQYDETNNEIILEEAVNFYKNEMIPKLKEIQELKYAVNIVEEEESAQKINRLIQLPNSLEDNEQFYTEDDKVVKFILGVTKANERKKKIIANEGKEEIANVKPKTKTRKETANVKPKNKTRKKKEEIANEGEEEIANEGEEEIANEDKGEEDSIPK